jgi:2-polyprenyl-3-methyl-5-hydroxy-6-metoxy-1,4-benzoquinol methylase
MQKIKSCIICGQSDFSEKFTKASAIGDFFKLVKCNNCGLKFLQEVPDETEISEYYQKEYFTKRTERGYDNYFSGKIKNEIERVFKLNLTDLGFFELEKKLAALSENKFNLDIGCAAGYFVNYMKERGWKAEGIDISKECIDFALRSGLDVRQGNYLKTSYNNKFDLITLWSTIEHLHKPDLVLSKAFNDLKNDGMLYISTCRADGFNFMKLFGKKWRFYNFPEHMYFFSYDTINKLLKKYGFKIIKYKTYGSNISTGGTFLRKMADNLAKKLYLGDMMIIAATKKS